MTFLLCIRTGTPGTAHIYIIRVISLSKSFDQARVLHHCSGSGWRERLFLSSCRLAVHLLMNSVAPTAGMCRVRPGAPSSGHPCPDSTSAESISNSHSVMEHQGDKFMHTCTRPWRPVAAGPPGVAVRACVSVLLAILLAHSPPVSSPCPWSELRTIQLQSLKLFQGDKPPYPIIRGVPGSRFHLQGIVVLSSEKVAGNEMC